MKESRPPPQTEASVCAVAWGASSLMAVTSAGPPPHHITDCPCVSTGLAACLSLVWHCVKYGPAAVCLLPPAHCVCVWCVGAGGTCSRQLDTIKAKETHWHTDPIPTPHHMLGICQLFIPCASGPAGQAGVCVCVCVGGTCVAVPVCVHSSRPGWQAGRVRRRPSGPLAPSTPFTDLIHPPSAASSPAACLPASAASQPSTM